MIGIHPGKMGRAEKEPRIRVHPDAVGSPGNECPGQVRQYPADGAFAAGFIQKRRPRLGPDQVGAGRKEPEGRIGVSRLRASAPRIILGKVPFFSY
jgi:hypothetical protein